MPHIDMIACDADQQRRIDIQVKTKSHPGRWAGNIRDGAPHQEPVSEEKFWVLVDLSDDAPQFYTVPRWWMQNYIHTKHQAFLARHGGVRPKSPDSKDVSILPADMQEWKNSWSVLGIFAD